MRLIDADKLKQHYAWLGNEEKELFDQIVDAQPTIKTERQMGHWEITDAYPHRVYCSNCYKTFAHTHWSAWEDGSLPRKYCPNCGAKMEVEE